MAHVEKAEKAEKPPKADRPEKAEKPERAERERDKADKAEKSEKTPKGGGGDLNERTGPEDEKIADKLAKHLIEYKDHMAKSKDSFMKRWTGDLGDIGAIGDFDLLKTIGQGAFGIVFLAKHLDSGDFIALKLVEKKVTVKKSQVVHIKNEIKLLYCCRSSFLVRLRYFFKDNVYLYLGMPFISGGEMYFHLRKLKKFDEALCRFYAAQVAMGLEYLHFMGVVHRDLKPENVLVTTDGYCQVCDFGFCKKIDDSRTYTLCGTPDYIAPEIILNKGHGFSADWWSFGILIYEMAAGYAPFTADSPIKLYEKVLAGKFRTPSHFSKAIRDLLANLIVVDRTMRFGCLKRGTLDIKANQWFLGFDWDAVYQKRFKPPYKPSGGDGEDTSNFMPMEEGEGAMRRASQNEYSYAFNDFTM